MEKHEAYYFIGKRSVYGIFIVSFISFVLFIFWLNGICLLMFIGHRYLFFSA